MRITEREDTAVRGHHEVAPPSEDGTMPTMATELRYQTTSRGKSRSWERAVEARITEGKDTSIRCHQPVARPI